jgi:hypothetical protein
MGSDQPLTLLIDGFCDDLSTPVLRRFGLIFAEALSSAAVPSRRLYELWLTSGRMSQHQLRRSVHVLKLMRYKDPVCFQ